MSPARRSLLVQVFQQMDNTGNGSISIAEYRSAVASQTMLSFFEYLDAQGVADGEVTLDEWLKGMGALGANLNDAQFMKELKKLLSLVVNTGAFPPSAGLAPAGGLRKHVRVAQVRFVNFEKINLEYSLGKNAPTAFKPSASSPFFLIFSRGNRLVMYCETKL